MAGEKIAGKITLDNIAERKSSPENIGESSHIEQSPDILVEKKIAKDAEKIKETDNQSGTTAQPDVPGTKVQSFQTKRAIEIDSILSEGLHEVFLKMGPIRQKEFKLVGEETALKISNLLDKGGVKVIKIINLIKNWLKLIPGVNKFFLEQEAKIKADKIMSIKNN